MIYIDEEKKTEIDNKRLQPLTRRQFKLVLLENGLLQMIENKINNIQDPSIKAKIQIEYAESNTFELQNESVQYMLTLLQISPNDANQLWKSALTL